MDKAKKFLKTNKRNIIVLLIIIVGFFVRIYDISSLPAGLNQDEASAGYEAYSISNYGIDRNGKENPVHLIAWGNGQNVLYTYMMIPFVKIFGLNEFSVRLPMALIGCISLLIFYLLLKKFKNEKIALIGLFFLAICPWHIMKSRWGLESNLFPDLILLSSLLICYGLNDKKVFLYLGYALCGISAYSYGTSYFFLPMFLIPFNIFLYIKKKITLKDAVLSIGLVGIISLPIILFIFINNFDLKEIKLPFLTIPRLNVNRYQEISSLFSPDFISRSIKNFKGALDIFIMQQNDMPWNLISFYGVTYVISLPFFIIGLYNSFKKTKDENNLYTIFNFWFIAAVLLLFVCEPNVNRCNIIIFPIIFFIVLGLYEIYKKFKKEFKLIIIMYIILFVSFLCKYTKSEFYFLKNFNNVINYVDKMDEKHVYITDNINQPYIYVLFYLKYDVNDYIDTVKFGKKKYGFDVVKSFGKYNFYIPKTLKDDSIYVVNSLEEISDKQKEKCNIEEYYGYYILKTRE